MQTSNPTTNTTADASGTIATPVTPPGIVPDYATPILPAQKTWHAGTLTYTNASLRMLFFWLLWGDFTLMLRERSVGQTFQLLLKKYDASDFVLALLITFLPQGISVLLGPVVSYRSDRHRGRWGRRIPFLLIPTPLAFLGMVCLAFSPRIGHWVHTAVLGADPATESRTIIATFAVSWTMFEVCAIIAGSVLGGLINDVVPREVMGRFYGAFRILSLGAGMLFSWFLIEHAETHYIPIFLGIGLLFAVSFSLMCLKVKEGDYPPPDGAAPAPPGDAKGMMARGSFLGAVRVYFRECFTNPYYVWYFGSIAFAYMAFAPINTFTLYFMKSVKMDVGFYGKLSTLQLGLSLVQAYPVGWLADRFHPLRLTIIAVALYGIATLLAFLFVRDAVGFGIAHVLCGTIAGFWLTAYSPLGPALLPKMKFATFSSAMTLLISAGTMIVGPACGAFLDRMHHQYHYMYLWSAVLMACSFACSLVVYRKFMAYGGPAGYVAPE